jgi:hypothetical protein
MFRLHSHRKCYEWNVLGQARKRKPVLLKITSKPSQRFPVPTSLQTSDSRFQFGLFVVGEKCWDGLGGIG